MKITQISLQRPVTVTMFFLAVILLGVVSLRQLSVDLLPDINYPRLSVITQYPGVAPQEVETLVTRPLEASVSRIPGLRRVESISQEGLSILSLEFSWGTDMDFALLHTREKLDNVLLPEDVEEPTIITLDPQSRPILILSVSAPGSLLEIKELCEELIKPRLEQIEGVGSAEIAGGVEREIQVEVHPELMALYQLTIDEISQKIDSFNRNLQGGTIRKGRFKYAIRVVGEFERVDELNSIVLKSTPQRGIVRLKDVATVKDSIKEREGITRLNGQESIGVLVRKESGANTVKVTQVVHQVLDEIRQENPELNIFVVYEQARYIRNAINSVVKSILFGGLLAFLVLFIFLQDFKTPVIISVVIPISVIATFNILYFQNITLNIMSLGGLALGIGMLVDNSIVVSESIFRHRTLGKSGLKAAYEGTKEVGMAVTASTLTTISVFLPIIYIHGMAGQLFKDQALTVTFSLLASLFVSLTLLPMLTSRELQLDVSRETRQARFKDLWQQFIQWPPGWPVYLIPFLFIIWLVKRVFLLVFLVVEFLVSFLTQGIVLVVHYLLRPLKPVVNRIFTAYNRLYHSFAEWYHRFLLIALDRKAKVLGVSVLILLITIGVGIFLPRELLPKPQAQSFELNLETPVDYSLEQTAKVVGFIEDWLTALPEVKDVFSQIGVVSGMEAYNPEISLNTARLYVEVKSPRVVDQVMEQLRQKLQILPELNYSLVKEQSTLAQFLAFSTAEVGLKIKGDDLEVLQGLAKELSAKLKEIPGVADVRTNLRKGKPVYLVKIKTEALEKYQISPAAVSSFLVNAVRGRIASRFNELDKKYDIRVRWEESRREDLDKILDTSYPYQGTAIPLRDLVAYELVEGPQEIRRENQQREVLISANLQGRKISQVIPEIRKKIAELNLPPKYRVEFGGEQEEMARSFRSLIFALSLAILLVYMIMAAQFESLKHPFIIILTLPMGLVGSIWALLITGQTINVISVIGMVVLAGIVVNDAIVKIDYTNQLRRRGIPLRSAIMEASRVRLRPILMTTVTTVLGLFPMALGLGRGSELQQPLAIAVIGGLLLATFLTLVLIPLIYELVEAQTAGPSQTLNRNSLEP
ncbi:MAG: efflux RND transporter permease subunit [Candidatus Aminicenantes bacterium]|nr:efflux RND transporter permease subunit [Candidatus Aminicenantes bacterium]